MIDYNLLLSNPEIAKNVRFEISGENLLEIASLLAKSVQPEKKGDEVYISKADVMAMAGGVSRCTLWRWNKEKILQHNQIGLYKKSDVMNFLNKK